MALDKLWTYHNLCDLWISIEERSLKHLCGESIKNSLRRRGGLRGTYLLVSLGESIGLGIGHVYGLKILIELFWAKLWKLWEVVEFVVASNGGKRDEGVEEMS